MKKRRTDPLNFGIVKRQIIDQYISLYHSPRLDDDWSLKNCIELFRVFYILYKKRFGVDHPNLSNEAIATILEEIPYIGDPDTEADATDYVTLEEYPDLIEAYFDSKFSGECDYTMPHFMSGKIRMMKYYEAFV